MTSEGAGVHLLVSLTANRLPPPLGVPSPLRAAVAQRAEAGAAPEASADDRVAFLRSVTLGWFTFAFIAGLVMVGLAYVGHAVGGDGGRSVGLAVGAALGFFCLTGGVYSTWKTVWGVRRDERRSRVGNSSLAVQALVAIAAFVVVLVYV